MNIRSVSSLLLILILGAWTASAQSTTTQIADYKDSVSQCESAIGVRNKKVGDTYESEVFRLKSQFQKVGELEKAVAADKEWNRFINQKSLGAGDVVGEPAELKQLQEKYLALFSQLTQSVAQERIEALNDIKRQFTMAGKLDDGMAVQQEIEKIKRRYLTEAAVGEGSGVTKKPADVVAQCEQAIRDRINTAQAQYVKELEALSKSYQAKGELESVFAVKNESERYMNAVRIEDNNIVQAPAELRGLQIKYKALPEQIGQQTAKAFLAGLEEQKKNLTVQGKLDDAMAVKKDIEKIQARYNYVAESLKDAVVRALVGKWHMAGGNGWSATFTYLADGRSYYDGVDNSRRWTAAGRWTVNDGVVFTTWDEGNKDKLEFINAHEVRQTNVKTGTVCMGTKLE